jgi:hypothetical protein
MKKGLKNVSIFLKNIYLLWHCDSKGVSGSHTRDSRPCKHSMYLQYLWYFLLSFKKFYFIFKSKSDAYGHKGEHYVVFFYVLNPCFWILWLLHFFNSWLTVTAVVNDFDLLILHDVFSILIGTYDISREISQS